jgi:hypothetical protein
VKDLLTEGNAALYPSRGLLKYVIDRPRSPVTAYLGPGNLVAESQTSTIGATGPPPNTVRGEFADAAQNYRLALIEVVASDIGSELLNEQTTSLKTVTRESQAIRVLAYGLKKTRLALRRYSWKSPLAALPSEPFDVVRLGYHTPARRHGYSGYLQAGSTALLLVLDQAVPLVAGTTYEVLVNIQRLNLPLVRTFIATATRAQVTIAIAPALGAVPEPGDLYGIGVLGAAMVTVLLDHVAMDETATTLTLAGAEYRPDIYDTAGTGVLPQTQTAFHDFPALYAEDITTRYHASYRSTPVSGQREATDPWPGAQLYRSQDPVDEDYLLDTQGAPLPCMGTALTALPAAPAQTTDFVSTVDVTVSGGILTSITPGELQMGFNALLLGTELLNFRIAEDLGGDTYRLRQLRRGRRGTEVQVGTHQSGERCLLIGTGVFTRDMLAQERSRTRNWKSPTIGEDVTQVAPAPYAAPSLNLVPWTVGSARGVQLSDGTWRLSWRGRARFWGEWVDGEEATPDADFVHYLLTIYQDATRAQVVHQVALGQGLAYQTPATFMYSAAQQQSDFGSVQTTLYWDCVQVGLDGTSAPLLLVSQAGEGT